ncbi:hypothetical protein F4782DRAFT_518984 [Xylaria castorea]|nr:hypothetical protein F4782DRAFT_518984 [Xylaria castorea]
MFKLVSRSRSLLEGKGIGRRADAKVSVTHVPDKPLHGGPETVSDKTLRTRPSYNDYATPVDVSKDADQYVSRPLPATPTSKANMADRPSTSGGPGSSKTAKNDFKFDKRVSRDDFYLGSRAYGETRSGPSASFQGQPPTPDTSPRTAPVQRFRSATTTTWEPTSNPTKEVRSGNIGMALGSPTHPPNFTDTWKSQNVTRPSKDLHPIESPPASRSSSVDTFDMPMSRKPTGRWKLFGLFGRKQSNQSIPAVSISDPNGLYGTNRPEEVAAASQASLSSGPKSPSRSNTTTSRKAPRHKPIVIRSQTMPLGVKADAYEKTRGREKRGDGNFGRIPIALDTGVESNPAAKPSLLNVEIPDVRLERYSVMFNGVLNSNPSLLSRRQANVPKLKSVEDVVERAEEQKHQGAIRRETSLQPATRSSGLALFPTSRQGQNLMPHRPSPRLRSNTSPALLPSPSRATFHRKTPSPQRPSVVETSSVKHSRHPSPPHQHQHHHEKPGIAVTIDSHTTEREPSPSPRQFSNGQSHLILDSPTDIEPEGDDATAAAIPWQQAWRPATNYQPPPEPKWQMISPSQKTPSTASSYASSSSHRKRSPSLASSSRTHITQPSEDFVVDDTTTTISHHPDGKMMTPVEISIARQISMSRQQRHMLLQPLRTGNAMPPPPLLPLPSVSVSLGSSSSSGSGRKQSTSHMPPGVVAVGEPGRIAETKMSTPTLVHPPDLLDPHNVVLLAQHRRSERIVLEDA